MLLCPIIFVIYSARFTGERISRRARLGISLSALGAATIVLLPVALGQRGEFEFFPLATLLAIIVCVIYPLSTVDSKRLNTTFRIPMFAILGVISWVVTIVNLVIWWMTGMNLPSAVSKAAIAGILYAAIFSALIARALTVWSYEKIGSASISALIYFESLLSVLIPIFFIGEALSLEVAVGGILILLGVFVVEHRHDHAYHHKILKHH